MRTGIQADKLFDVVLPPPHTPRQSERISRVEFDTQHLQMVADEELMTPWGRSRLRVLGLKLTLHCPARTSFLNTRSHYVGLELYVKSRLASNSNKFSCLCLTSASIKGV